MTVPRSIYNLSRFVTGELFTTKHLSVHKTKCPVVWRRSHRLDYIPQPQLNLIYLLQSQMYLNSSNAVFSVHWSRCWPHFWVATLSYWMLLQIELTDECYTTYYIPSPLLVVYPCSYVIKILFSFGETGAFYLVVSPFLDTAEMCAWRHLCWWVPWRYDSVKVEMKFHFECKLRSPCAT